MAEFLALRETNRLIELIDGDVIVNPPPLDAHQETAGNLYTFLRERIQDGALRFAPTGLYLDEQYFVEPDLFWGRAANENCVLMDGKYWRGAPDLVVEILSPGTAQRDREDKFARYQAVGVREYWLVEPSDKTIAVYRLQSGAFVEQDVYGLGDTFTSAVLYGETVSVRAALIS